MSKRAVWVYTGLLMWMLAPAVVAAPKQVSFSQPPRSVDAYDFVEITVNVEGPDATNPFTDATLRGSFGKVNGTDRTAVEGFCDSADGGVFRIRVFRERFVEFR